MVGNIKSHIMDNLKEIKNITCLECEEDTVWKNREHKIATEDRNKCDNWEFKNPVEILDEVEESKIRSKKV